MCLQQKNLKHYDKIAEHLESRSVRYPSYFKFWAHCLRAFRMSRHQTQKTNGFKRLDDDT